MRGSCGKPEVDFRHQKSKKTQEPQPDLHFDSITLEFARRRLDLFDPFDAELHFADFRLVGKEARLGTVARFEQQRSQKGGETVGSEGLVRYVQLPTAGAFPVRRLELLQKHAACSPVEAAPFAEDELSRRTGDFALIRKGTEVFSGLPVRLYAPGNLTSERTIGAFAALSKAYGGLTVDKQKFLRPSAAPPLFPILSVRHQLAFLSTSRGKWERKRARRGAGRRQGRCDDFKFGIQEEGKPQSGCNQRN